MQKLVIGILGFGSMGRTHLFSIQNLPFFYPNIPFIPYVKSLCTTTEEKTKAMAELFHIPHPCTSEDDIIYDPEIDVVDICTPNNCHFETIKKAIRAGKKVLCEKPLCFSLEEANEIAKLTMKEGQTCGMVFNNRWLAPCMRAKQLIEEGRIGRILHFEGKYLHSSATDLNKPIGWKQNKNVCGGGVLFDLGSHIIDLLSYLCGPLTQVSGMSQIAYPTRVDKQGNTWQTNADEGFILMGKTKENAQGTITVGKVQVGTNDDLSFKIYGEKGALEFSLMEPNWLYFYDNTLQDTPLGGLKGFTRIECVGKYPDRTFPSLKAPVGWLSGHVHSMYNFLTACANQQKFSPSLQEGIYVQKVLHAAYESAENQSRLMEVLP